MSKDLRVQVSSTKMINNQRFIDLYFIAGLLFSISFIYLIPNIFIYLIIGLNLVLYVLLIICYSGISYYYLKIKQNNITEMIKLYENVFFNGVKLSNILEELNSNLLKVSFSDDLMKKQIYLNKLNTEVFFLKISKVTETFLKKSILAENAFVNARLQMFSTKI